MKTFMQLSALALGLLACTASAEEAAEAPSDVHVLKTDTFESFLNENPLVLAEFYAPWCGHCKALAPEYEDAATKLKEKSIPLAKVDCTVETDLCEKQGVQGYPTIKVFRGPDNSSPYQGQRKSDAIVSYMIKNSLPAVSVLDKETYDDFTKADKVVLVAFFDKEDKESNATYTQVAESLRDTYLFGATNDAALAEAAGVKVPAVVLFKTFDEGKNVFDGEFKVEKITDFAKVASTPLVGEVGPETYAGYMDAGIPLAYIFVENDDDKTKYSNMVKPLAEKFKGKINFATIDAAAFGAHAGNLNLEQKWPAFSIQETAKNQKFPFHQSKEITEKDLTQFVEDFVAGKIEPSIKSEPIPEKQEGPVHVVVAHNYESIVNDGEKDVLVEYYAPWCGHCKNLAPKYEELGKLYFNNPEFAKKVVIAKVDATANDVPIEIQGFPTIKLFPAGSKDAPVDYAGSRTVEDLASFVKEHGTHKIDAYVAPAAEAKEEKPAAEEPLGEAAAAASKVAEAVTEKVESATEKVEEAVKSAEPQGHDEL
ncbi:protein disulfide-isomerase [Pyronema domesticum]|uniref:Protein disulfide-isomerase n=1 Tax=Pyronema omphalodes (strain CBS 100304) TaxID=1076935 RepID=U4LSY7_PYROM|nr:protein disulfide-isomerase [Pyronema domesticum]CCX30471.1 Similar to Protein disulfide-isomerase; acc. no. P55059 [Pyronema omphalodes CBS 100304]